MYYLCRFTILLFVTGLFTESLIKGIKCIFIDQRCNSGLADWRWVELCLYCYRSPNYPAPVGAWVLFCLHLIPPTPPPPLLLPLLLPPSR